MAFEVYFGNAGVWQRVILEGSGTDNNLTIKTSTDSLLASIIDAGSILPLLAKSGRETIRTSLTEFSTVVSSGVALKIGAETIRPTLTETARVAVFITRTETIAPRITETLAISKSGEGVSRVYGSGTFGSGLYGTSNVGTVTTTTLVTVNDSKVGIGELQHEFSTGWTLGTGVNNFNSDDHFSATAGLTWTYRFKGTRLRLYGAKASNHGIGSMVLDANAAVDVDYYSSIREDQVVVYDTGTLPNGDHILKMTVTGRKNPSATNAIITVDRTDVDSSGLTVSP